MKLISTPTNTLTRGSLNYALSKCSGGASMIKYNEDIKRSYVRLHLGDSVEIPLDILNLDHVESMNEITIERADEMDSDELYVLRVYQLETEGMTTSDAQGVADYEQEHGHILNNTKAYIEEHKPSVLMSSRDIDDLAETALNAACLAIQNRLGVKEGDFASAFFSDNEVKNKLVDYINAENEFIKDTLEERALELVKSRNLSGQEMLWHHQTYEAKPAIEWARQLIIHNPNDEPFSMWAYSQIDLYTNIDKEIAEGKIVLKGNIATETTSE